MERPKKEKRHRKKSPRVPIKTYKWEDVRRARLKGGYPWTYLYKEPFSEEADPKLYTMESKSKGRSFSLPRKSSDQLEIREITNGSSEERDSHRGSLTPEPSGYIVITEVPSDSEIHSKDAPRGSVTIEDVGEVEAINLESAEDSDNISQYLDREEPPVEAATTSGKPTKEEEVKPENGRQERAKSEEPKRKRKLSIESSYSRKSLSKLAIMKKLKEAKDKIKIPKLSFPSMPTISVLANPLKQDTEVKSKKEKEKTPEKKPEKKSEKEEKKSEKKSGKSKDVTTRPDPNAKPVYIHIPLKPPEGQTDEFSYLEFGDKKPEEPTKEEELKKQLEETPTIEISDAFDNQRRYSENPDEIVAFEIVKTETIDLEHAAKNGLQGGNDYLIIEQEDDNKSESRSMIIIMPGNEEPSGPSLSRTSSRRQTPSRQGSKRVRAKSAEPERKRKLSADSGYSRISLSKLGFLQKLKDATDKLKLPKFSLSRSNSKKSPNKKMKEDESSPNEGVDEGKKDKIEEKKSKPEDKKSKAEEKKSKTEEKKSKPEDKKSKGEDKKSKTEEKKSKTEEKKSAEPKYIHIPLKPPPGETDEFSHLEFEEKKIEPKVEEEKKEKEVQEQSSVESPGSVQSEGVHFIFLTPPSDEEVLEQPDIPETPSSESKGFFTNRLHELKQLAKDAVDSASPKSRKKLQPVTEEESSEASGSKTEVDDTKKIETEAEKLETPAVETKDEKLTSETEKEKLTTDAIKETIVVETKEETPKTEIKEETATPVGDTQIKAPDNEKEILISETKKEKSKTKAKKEKSKGGTKKEKSEKEKGDNLKDAPDKSKEVIKDKKADDIKDTTVENEDKKVEKMVVDEEDGLKLTESAIAKQEQNIKAKTIVDPTEEVKPKTDGSPVMKKKVSFKRRSKDDSKDGDYEDIQAPKDDNLAEKNMTDEHKSKLTVMGNSQSMSVDEEKSYLDEQKIIKTTSLEEDYNRWSKLSDHEYEPVNPPPDNVSPVISLVGAAPPTVHVIDTDQGLPEKQISLASSTTSLERRMLGAGTETSPEEPFTVQEMQTEIENKYFGKTAEIPPQPQTTVHTVTTVTTSERKDAPAKSQGPGKFQKAIKAQTDKFRTKLHEIKKPNIKLPSKPTIKKPNLQKFKFEKPKISLPKIPDTTKINLPTFSLPRRNPQKRSLKERQLSTESNAGGSKKNYFDFRTYPRLFKKKPKDDFDSFSSKSEREVPEFATVPRTKRNKEDEKWGGQESVRIPLHAQESESVEDEEREDSVERRMASHMRYDQDIDIDDAYEKENQEIHSASPFSHGYNSRWNHGSFHPQSNQEFSEDTTNRQVTDLDSPGDDPAPHESFDTNTSKDIHSSESSLGIHRRGVLEEIDSDEFFLRQKGISQDNIEVGMYLSSEIREAFKYPTNALADLQRDTHDFSYDARASNQSLPETPSKRKAAKKPKRKKTPHVSHEQISFDQDSELDLEVPPSRPKRRSKRNKKQKDLEGIVPYQETIAVPDVTVGILRNVDDHERLMYENEQMQGKEQPEIKLTDPYAQYRTYDSEEEDFNEEFREDIQPSAPPRKHRSLKSLSYSEHDSILGDVDPDREPLQDDVEVYKTEHEYIIPTPELPPVKPPRTLSRSSSKSYEHEEFRNGIEETPMRPTRSRSGTRSHGDSLTLEGLEPPEEPREPCVEEACVQDIRDSMGYAIIDKSVRRDPPLPPPRTPPRRRKGVQSSEQRFFTVPRPVNDDPPSRPIRNYSTLGPSRPPRRKQPINMTDEEKENIDITQYIEIEDEPNRDLHSGEVIQKMRDRPLPAPPRPPRKSRTLQDITSQENIVTGSQEDLDDEEKTEFLEEAEVSTQTEPLPDDVLCEDAVHEDNETTVVQRVSAVEQNEPVVVERRLITPTQYSFEETITHGSLIVEPLNGAKILPDSQLTRPEKVERIVPVTKDYDDETSEIPEEFTTLRDPEPVQTNPLPVTQRPDKQLKDPSVQAGPPQPQPSVIHKISERPVSDSTGEFEVLKAHKLQVSDLDVNRLSVNELLAGRIVVSEIEGGSIQANEISSKSGALKIGEIELPPAIVQQLFEKLQSVAQEQSVGPIEPAAETSPKESSEDAGQKKTPFEQVMVETLPPQRPPRKTEESCESSVPPVDALTESPTDRVSTKIDSLNTLEIGEIQEIVEPPAQDTQGTTETSLFETVAPLADDIQENEKPMETLFEEIETTGEPLERIEESEEFNQRIEENEEPLIERIEETEESTIVERREFPETMEPPTQEIRDPPLPPIRTDSFIKSEEVEPVIDTSPETEDMKEEAPQRPPRQGEKFKTQESLTSEQRENPDRETTNVEPSVGVEQQRIEDSEIDDEPPPRPPEPPIDYIPSQPPASFYALRAQKYVETLEGDVPTAPRRRRHPKPPISRSSSEESPVLPPSRRRYRSPEPSIPQLTGQLIHACGSAAQSSIKRLIAHITNNVLHNADGQQDLHITIVILLVLIAGLILLGYDSGQTIHYHHWEFFNPPRDI